MKQFYNQYNSAGQAGVDTTFVYPRSESKPLQLSPLGQLTSAHARIDFLGLPLDTGIAADDVCALLGAGYRSGTITFVNPYSWAIAKHQADYLDLLHRSFLVLPDGEGVARACRLITDKPCPRVSFDMSSLAGMFFETAQELGRSIMLVGGSAEVGPAAQAKLLAKYPNLQLLATVDGYGDLEPKVAAVLAHQPAIVIVGMGSPYQERFMVSLQEGGYEGLIITCGGFLDQYLSSEQYYPTWINDWNLRFAWRLYKEPKRLWRRYLVDYQLMMYRCSVALLKKLISSFLLSLSRQNPD